jgi:hypothetical protein
MRYVPTLFVVAAFLFNVITAILGINKLSPKLRWTLLVIGFVLALIAGFLTWDQQQSENYMQDAILKIAIAQGIDLDQTPKDLADKSLKKQLGIEATHLSQEILVFLDSAPKSPLLWPPPDDQETRNKMFTEEVESTRIYMQSYDKQFAARTLSLEDRLTKLHLAGFRRDQVDTFEHPTNTLGIREVAQTLGRIGQTLLAEANEVQRKPTTNQ